MIKSSKIFIKKLYQAVIVKIFNFVYGKPKLLKNKIKDKSVNEYQIVLDGNKYQIFKFNYGIVFTNSNDTTAYISKNNFLSNASMQYLQNLTI